MQYVIHYEVAAFLICLVLAVIHITRHTYATRSNRIFTTLLSIATVTTVSDLISAVCISWPDILPMWMNYTFCITYLLSYNLLALGLLAYVDSLAKNRSIEKLIRYVVRGCGLFEIIFLVTTPFTRLVVYFDENKIYTHGPVSVVYYLISLVILLLSVWVLFNGTVRFSFNQVLTCTICVLSIIGMVGIQVIYPDYLLGGFASSIMVLYLYLAFSNPAYYTYKDTQCFNRAAFLSTVRMNIKHNTPYSIVAAGFSEYSNIKTNVASAQLSNVERDIADKLHTSFGDRAFFIADDRIAVLINEDDVLDVSEVRDSLVDIIERPMETATGEVMLKARYGILPPKYTGSSSDEIEDILNMLLTGPDDGYTDDYERVDSVVIKKKRYDMIVEILDDAVKNDGFKVYFQPILNVHTNKFESSEALVRLIDDRLGFISPEEFIPIAEKEGYILQIGEIVFKKVCEFMRDYDYKSLGIKYIEVNMSPIQGIQDNISDVFGEIMNEYGIEPKAINLEITETAEMEEEDVLVDNILRINTNGVGFSLDDFGSGFASMDYLFRLPVELVKVDKGILWQAMKDQNAMIVLTNTMSMVNDLHKKILVEGVETQEMVDILKSNGCDYMQGYFFSKPVPDKDYVEFLKARNF